MSVEVDDVLMSMRVERLDETGEYTVSVKAHGSTINTWSLGFDEAVAKGKVATILDSYVRGLEFIQEQVRSIFTEEETKL